MRIGIVIGRYGGIDGVALETEKWVAVLERLGHEVRVITGELEADIDQVTVLPELAFSRPAVVAAQRAAFFEEADHDERELIDRLEADAAHIAGELLRWIERERIDVLVSENANAIPMHLSMGMAVERVLADAGMPGVSHDHDFRWERGDRYDTSFAGVREILERCFPLTLPKVRHAVINSAARAALAERCGIDDAVVVPNVMDFDEPLGRLDDENAALRPSLGLDERDLLLFQITRIVRRKGIEIAIDLVRRLEDPRVKLVITGTSVDDALDGYAAELHRQVERFGLEAQVLFAGDRFDARRRRDPRGRPVWSLSDAYAHAAACTYFSLYEGFGNAFVEAVVAKVPIFVNAYEPVYWPDIGSKGFRTVMIRDGILTDEAVAQAREVLNDPAMARDWAEQNFALGREHFSFDTLERLLTPLFSSRMVARRPGLQDRGRVEP